MTDRGVQSEKLALNISETAALLGVSRPTVYQLLRRADFPAFRIASKTMISREGLAQWVRDQAGCGCADNAQG